MSCFKSYAVWLILFFVISYKTKSYDTFFPHKCCLLQKNPQSSFWGAPHENMTKIVHLIKLSHIPSSSINFSIVTITAPLFRKEVIGWKEAIASRRLGTKKVDVLKNLSTTADLEKIFYKRLKYWQKTSETISFSVSLPNISVLSLGMYICIIPCIK